MIRRGWILGLAVLVAIGGVAVALLWMPSAEQTAANTLPVAPAVSVRVAADEEDVAEEFVPTWVATFAPTELWAGRELDAGSFGPTPAGTPLQVLAPQSSSRLYVYNPLTEGVAWVDAAAVGPARAPTAAEVVDLRTPPPFEPYWAMTHRPAVAWSSPEDVAQPFNRIPQWRYLNVVLPAEGSRVFTFDPRSEAYAYVDLDALAPATRPSDDYFDPATAAPDQTLALPGRVVGSAAGRGHNAPVTVHEQVDRGAAGRGYRIADDVYVSLNNVRVPTLPQRTFPGRWIDANLSEPVLVTAYEGERPVFSGMAVKGVIGFQTPTGVFRILRRVANETMDSLTLGIPRASAHGYYLRNVLYTQYFTGDGAAIHYNYWLARWGYSGSHGCLGMNLDDSKFLWDFAEVGTPVFIHY